MFLLVLWVPFTLFAATIGVVLGTLWEDCDRHWKEPFS